MNDAEREYLDGLMATLAEELRKALDQRDGRPLLPLVDAAKRIGISERSLREMVAGPDPKIASLKVGPSEGTRVFEQVELDRYIDERRRAEQAVREGLRGGSVAP